MTEPTDDELDKVLCNQWPAFSMQATLVRVWVRAAMRDALAKWGTPQPVGADRHGLPPLPDPDLRDVGTTPRDIKEFLRGYATEYALTALTARAPEGSVLEDAARWRDWTQAFAEASAAPEDTVFMKAFEDAIGDSDAPFTAEQFTSWVDVARKQGEKQ